MISYGEWEEFQSKVVKIVDDLNEDKVPFKAYAQTYARSIVDNLKEGIAMGYSPAQATKTQLLYVICNLNGAAFEDIKDLQELAVEKGIDISDALQELEEADA